MLYDIDHDDGTLVAWLSPDESDGHTHHHIHDPDHLMCRGDISESWEILKKHYEGRDDIAIVILPHCIYPCWTVRQNRIDHNIAVLSEYP